jgi:putative transposase
VFADSIYNRLAALLACFVAGLVLIIVRRAAGSTGFVVQPRRWWSKGRSAGSADGGGCPGTMRRYEVSETMVTLAATRLMLHRLAHPNRRRLPTP